MTLVIDSNPDGTWNCICDCGRKFVRQHHKLSEAANKGTQSYCGQCIGVDPRIVIATRQLKSYRGGAIARGLAFELGLEDVQKIIFSPCSYCGLLEDKEALGVCFTGIDRMNNDIGYVSSNVASCCATCNFAKRNMEFDNWIAWLSRIRNSQINFPTSKVTIPPVAD